MQSLLLTHRRQLAMNGSYLTRQKGAIPCAFRILENRVCLYRVCFHIPGELSSENAVRRGCVQRSGAVAVRGGLVATPLVAGHLRPKGNPARPKRCRARTSPATNHGGERDATRSRGVSCSLFVKVILRPQCAVPQGPNVPLFGECSLKLKTARPDLLRQSRGS
jgi:hypothetical protein